MKHKDALNNEIFSVITKASVNLKLHSYVIGGYVRDYLLKRGLKKDIDIVTLGDGINLAKEVSNLLPHKPKVKVFKTYGTAMLHFNNIDIEESIKPDVIIVARGGGSIEDLWAFNEENIVNAVFESKIPI